MPFPRIRAMPAAGLFEVVVRFASVFDISVLVVTAPVAPRTWRLATIVGFACLAFTLARTSAAMIPRIGSMVPRVRRRRTSQTIYRNPSRIRR